MADEAPSNVDAAFFGGEYYRTLNSHREDMGDFYGPQSIIDFDGTHFSGENEIASMYNQLGPSHYIVTRVSSFVEPIMGLFIAIFLGNYTLAGEDRMFDQMFIFEEMGVGVQRRIRYSLFRTLPYPPADPLVPPADLPGPLVDLLVPPADPLVPPAQANGPVAPRAQALANGTATQSSVQGSSIDSSLPSERRQSSIPVLLLVAI